MRIAAALATALVATAAPAVEPFQSYDSFRQNRIDPERWLDGERVRRVREGELRLMQRSFGEKSDVGTTFIGWNENMRDPASITGIKARMRVNALEVGSCATNPNPAAQSRARIIGTFFGVDFLPPPATADSLMGDVIAQVRAVRNNASLDPPGVLRVQGFVSVCNSVDCISAINLFPFLDLGTLNIGDSTTVQVQWDQPSKTFLFSRDNGAFNGVVNYTFNEARPPNVAFKELSTRMDIPNCASAPSSGVVDAVFDRVSVTRSVAP